MCASEVLSVCCKVANSNIKTSVAITWNSVFWENFKQCSTFKDTFCFVFRGFTSNHADCNEFLFDISLDICVSLGFVCCDDFAPLSHRVCFTFLTPTIPMHSEGKIAFYTLILYSYIMNLFSPLPVTLTEYSG